MAGERNHVLQSGATVQIDSSSIGFTSGATTFKHSIDTSDIMANQSLLPIKSVKTAERGALSFGALELKRENLKVFYEGSVAIETSGDHRKLYIGGDQDVTEHAIDIYSRAEDDKIRHWTFYKCIRDGDVEYAMDLGAVTVLALNYKMLADLSKTEGKQLFLIDDDTSTAYDKDTGL